MKRQIHLAVKRTPSNRYCFKISNDEATLLRLQIEKFFSNYGRQVSIKNLVQVKDTLLLSVAVDFFLRQNWFPGPSGYKSFNLKRSEAIALIAVIVPCESIFFLNLKSQLLQVIK